MASPAQHSTGGSVWKLAAMQHGVVSREQLAGLGLSGRAVRHRVDRGRLHEVGRGVYAVGRPALTRRGRWMAAVLTYGPDSFLSHWSAAALMGISNEKQPVEVSVRTCSDRGRRTNGVRVHRRTSLRGVDVGTMDGIPVTAPIRTLIDLAATSDSDRIEWLINEADRLDIVNPVTLRGALGNYRGQRGVARLRAVLDPRFFRPTRSGLERRFLRIADRAGLPVPLTRQWVNDFEVDFYWPELNLVVETDGGRYHRAPSRQTRDRERDQAHTVSGLTQLRFTEDQIEFAAPYVIETLRAIGRRLEAARTISGLKGGGDA